MNKFIKSVMAAACAAVLAVPLTLHAQTYTVTTVGEFEARLADYETAAGNVVIEVGADLMLNSAFWVSGSGGRTLTIRSTAAEVRTLRRDTYYPLLLVDVNSTLVLENIIIDGGYVEPGPEPATPGQCVDSQNRPLFCQWDTGCFTVNNEYGDNAGKTCQDVIAECNRYGRLFYDVDPESLNEDNGYGEDMQCNAIGGKILAGKIAGGEQLINIRGGKLVMNDGAVLRNNGSASGVFVDQFYNQSADVSTPGIFEMNGGEISGNASGSNLAGGVHVQYSTFIMNGGKISGNAGGINSIGSGVSIVTGDAVFEMTGGEISGNSNGGVANAGTFTMSGGEINNNNEGGVFVVSVLATFTMSGGKINGNTHSHGPGVYIQGGGKFAMTGGEIIGNIGTFGNGVYMHGDNNVFAMNGGVIAGSGSLSSTGVIFTYDGSTSNINLGIPGNGVIIAYPDELARYYAENTSTDLHRNTGTTAVWAIENDKPGISYENGENKGFIEMLGAVVGPPSAITKHPSDITLLFGYTAQFSVTASPLSGATSISSYQWQVSTDNGVTFSNVTGGTSPTYTTPATTMEMNGNIYRCVVTDNISRTYTSLPAKLTVRPLGMIEDFERTNYSGTNFFGGRNDFLVPSEGSTRLPRVSGGHDGNGHHGEMEFSNLNATSNARVRMDLVDYTLPGGTAEKAQFDLITGFTFWAKADKPMTVKFNVYTAEDDFYVMSETYNMYGIEVPITTEWKQHTVNIFPIVPTTGTGAPTETSHGVAGDLRQENGRGQRYTFDRKKMRELRFEIRGSLNPGMTNGTFYIDEVSAVCGPQISAHPTGGTVNFGAERSLSVTAASALSYQWFSNATASNTGGTAITGATLASYSVPTDETGTYHYYVAVTNANGTVTSNVATINVVAATITSQPSGGAVIKDAARNLSVTATGTALSYQWFSNTTASAAGGTAIAGATSSSYTIPTSDLGTYHYYVVLTSTIGSGGDQKTATIASSVATVNVVPLVHAQLPKIDKAPPAGTTVTLSVGQQAAFDLLASSPDGGALSTQWYRNTTASNVGGTPFVFSGANAYLLVPTSAAGTFYYYAVVTNTNNSVNGNKTAVYTSEVITVVVGGGSSVLSPDRLIPQPDVGGNGAVSVNSLTSEFTAGPNPVAKQSSTVNFFWQGKRIQSATFTIFDASGNVVNKINIKDNKDFKDNMVKRIVGSWDLTDTKGRTVSDGTYLVKGVITVDGKKERVSIMVGVH